MRIRGRRLYPSTLAERRVMMALGGTPLYAPRGISPYLVARRLSRFACGQHPDASFLKDLFASRPRATLATAVRSYETEQAEVTGAQNPVAA